MKPMLGVERGQVSIEILLLAAVILTIGIVVLSYYSQIKDSTTSLQLLKVETLRLLDGKQEQFTMQEMKYKIAGGNVHFCISTKPLDIDSDNMEDALEDKLTAHNVFLGRNVAVHYNRNLGSCD